MRIRNEVIASILIVGVTLSFSACASDSGVNPEEPKASQTVAPSDVGSIRILTANPEHTSLSKSWEGFYAEKLIKADEGGVIEAGDDEFGKCRILVGENALPEDMTLSVRWAAQGILQAEFGPHGAIFNNPVRVEFSYKSADLDGTTADKLRIFYFNEDEGLWELIGGEVDKKKEEVSTYLWHFSGYGIASPDE